MDICLDMRKIKGKTHQSCNSYVINRFTTLDYRRKTCSPKMHFSLWRWFILVTPVSCEMGVTGQSGLELITATVS